MNEETAVFEGWCILELMGHRKLGGYIKEVQIAGAGFPRIDVPYGEGDPPNSTQFYPPSSVYSLVPTTEKMARAVAATYTPQPVQRWELPSAPAPTHTEDSDSGSSEVDDELTDEERNEIF